jgi:hypothetical protein
VLVSSFYGNLAGSLIGSGLILIGLPLYEWIRRRYQPPIGPLSRPQSRA